MNKPFQRKGAASNTQVGNDFECKAQEFFKKMGLLLTPRLPVEIGINGRKLHRFDFGNEEQKVLVECKSHTWTEGDKVPSAKMMAWNEAMFIFYASPPSYRKVFFVLRAFSRQRKRTLAEYYLQTYYHLIPSDVEVWEFDETTGNAKKIK